MHTLPLPDQAYCGTFRHQGNRARSIAVRLLLKQRLASYGLPYFGVARAESGQPSLANYESHLSISHSDTLVGAIISQNKTGLDLETIKEKSIHVAPRFLKPREIAANFVDSPEQASLCFSLKEAAYKLFSIPGLSVRDSLDLIILTRPDDDSTSQGSAICIANADGQMLQAQLSFWRNGSAWVSLAQ